jgi:hypothetical protein
VVPKREFGSEGANFRRGGAPARGVVPVAEEPWRGENLTRGRPVRARAAGSKTLEKEGQESCRRTGRVKPAGERGASEWEEGFRAGPSPGWKPVRASGRGALSGDGRGTDMSAAVGPVGTHPGREGHCEGRATAKEQGTGNGTRSFRSEAL